MVTETEQRIKEDIKLSRKLLSDQNMKIKDGERLIDTMSNLLIRYQQIRESRDSWRERYNELSKRVKGE